MPLVTAEDSTSGTTRVRVWSEPGLLPELVGGNWLIKDNEVVKGESRLTGLVLLAERPARELQLRLSGAGANTGVTVLIERALVRVHVDGSSLDQVYWASYRLARIAGQQIEVELPAGASNLQIKLDGQTVSDARLDVPGEPGVAGLADDNTRQLARVPRVQALVKPGSILEVSYRLPPTDGNGPRSGGLLQTVLQPPVVRGAPPRVLTRWQVNLPGGRVVLAPEGGIGSERTWSRRGWLLAPQPAISSADLNRWLSEDEPAVAEGPGSSWPAGPDLTCWRGRQEPLVVVHVPQQTWLLLCSLVVLFLGLAVGFLVRRSGKEAFSPLRAGLALTLLGLAAVVIGIFWPTLLAAIVYGSQPGLLVLVLIGVVQWLLHEQHRRKLVFLPSFSRRNGSSINPVAGNSSARRIPPRTGSGHKGPQHGEPSTVDVPRPV